MYAFAHQLQAGTHSHLVRGKFRSSMVLEALTGGDADPSNYAWYYFFLVSYRKSENSFPWIRFLITFLTTLGTAPIFIFLNNLAKCVNTLYFITE